MLQVAIVLSLLIAGNAQAASSGPGGHTTAVASAARLGGDNAKTRFVAELSVAVGYKVYVIPDPFRVILDLPDIDFRIPSSMAGKGRGLVSSYRYGRIDENRSRIVLDTKFPVLIDRSFILNPRDGQPARIVVDIVRTDRETFDTHHRREQPQPPPAPVSALASLETESSPLDTELEQMSADEEPIDPPVDVSSPPAPPSQEAAENDPALEPKAQPNERVDLPEAAPVPLPLQRPTKQLAAVRGKSEPPRSTVKPRNTKPIVVIDPGHGGIDPGALSRNKKLKEKNIVLKFAKRLKQQLDVSGRYKVLLTRADDRFLTLRERVKVARNANADLFVAIHADSIRGRRARGATVYTVSEKASDREAAELAHAENRSDIIAGVDLAAESDEIAGILIDLAQRETKNYSAVFAKRIVGQLKAVTKLNARPMRSAGFRVLMAPDVPSVLLELGYMSNRNDIKLLQSDAWHSKVARALGKAVDRYFATRLAAGN